MNSQRQKNDAQLLLLLPSDWVGELDTIAKEHFQSRLSLIREYIRERMDEDLCELDEKIAQREQVKRAKSKVDGWLLKELQRKEADKW